MNFVDFRGEGRDEEARGGGGVGGGGGGGSVGEGGWRGRNLVQFI